jgi:hypothetical protein
VRKILVKPVGDGWALKADGLDGDMIFRSGRLAERAAHALSARLAIAGETTEIAIMLKDGSLAARFVVPANEN